MLNCVRFLGVRDFFASCYISFYFLYFFLSFCFKFSFESIWMFPQASNIGLTFDDIYWEIVIVKKGGSDKWIKGSKRRVEKDFFFSFLTVNSHSLSVCLSVSLSVSLSLSPLSLSRSLALSVLTSHFLFFLSCLCK